jgi:cbb3-type cytochrome oxidase subunit 1
MGMDPFVRRFIRASVLWLCIGVLLGLAMAFWPAQALAYRPAHAHANLLGFVSMMIFGVAYHVIPRFAARPLHAPRLAAAHFWLANAGLVLLVGGWITTATVRAGAPLLHTGGMLFALGAFAFAWNIWRTLGDGAPATVGIAANRPPHAAPAR